MTTAVGAALGNWSKTYYFATSILLAIAVLVPPVWHYFDSKRRLELKQTAFVGCLLHHATKDISTCERMRPEVLAPSTYQLCLWRYTAKQCAPYRQ
jgi:hypothetical protein